MTAPPSALRTLLLEFESLGCDCEFGLVQRRFGAEPLSLLRFAAIRPDALLTGLATGFERVDDPADLELETVQDSAGRSEYWVRHRRYGMRAHTFRFEGEQTSAAVLEEQSRKLRFQRRRFLDLLASGEKLFVFHDQDRLSPGDARAILAALRCHGPGSLLCVSAGAAPGSVEPVEPGLYSGQIGGFGDGGEPREVESWVEVCRSAWRLWLASSGQGRLCLPGTPPLGP